MGYYNDNWEWVSDDEPDPYVPPAPAQAQTLGTFGVPINSGAPAGTQDLSYWQSRHDEGLPGAFGVDDMFDENGQLRPGWVRTAKGYERVPTTAAPPAPPTRDPETPSPTRFRDTTQAPLSFSGSRAPGSFLPYPTYENYNYESPGDFEPSVGPFAFDPYTPSSWADAENEPGFKKAEERLSKMVQNSAAYQGVLRSGATIGRLDSVLDTNQGQNFAQFDARRFRNWDANRDNAFQTWSSKYGIDKDKYTFRVGEFDRRNQYGAQNVDRKNNYNFNVADRSFQDELSRWQEQVRSLTQLARPVD